MKDNNIVPHNKDEGKYYSRTKRTGWTTSNTYKAAADTPWGDGPQPQNIAEASRWTPARQPNLESDLLVPLGQSIICGLSACLGVLGSALYLDVSWKEILAAFCFVTPLAWWILSNNTKQTMWQIEHIFGAEDEAPPAKRNPEVAPLEVIHRNEKGGLQSMQRFPDLSQAIIAKLPEFACGIGQKGLAEASWTGSGGLFSKGEYKKLMDTLTEAGLVEWVNPEAKPQGRRLTEAGKETFEKWT